MFVTKIKMTGLVLFVVGLLAAGGGVLTPVLTAAPQLEAQRKDPTAKQKPDAKPVSVRVVKPTPGGLERIARGSGKIIAAQQQNLGPLIAGIIKEVTVDIGDRVKKGQVLIVLDAPLVTKESEQATAAFEVAKAQVNEAEAQVRIAEIEVESAAMDLKRLAGNEAVIPASKLVVAKANAKVKQGKLAHVKASLQTARANARMAEVTRDKARIQAEFVHLKAAFDGVVTRRTADVGNFVQPSDSRLLTPLLTLQRLDRVRVVAQIHGWAGPFVERGDTVLVDVFSRPSIQLPDQKIARFSRVIDGFQQGELFRETTTVEIDVPNADMRLLPGMGAQATVHLKKRFANAFVVPVSCVGEHGLGSRRLFVVRDGKAHETLVEVTYDDGKNVEIYTGIKASDLIAVNKEPLKEGMPVIVEKAP